MSFSVLATGFKGSVYIERLFELGCIPERIYSYDQKSDHSRGFRKICEAAKSAATPVVETKRPDLTKETLAFAVGWQFLLAAGCENLVVFHDSLLPRYRGFSPTVSALINGDREIGISALRPVQQVDAGPIVAQRTIPITYPIKIAEALIKQAAAMADVTAEILKNSSAEMIETEQDETSATYSIWRDADDYVLDWRLSSNQLSRTVDALGFPYDGARTTYKNAVVIVDRVEVVQDLVFHNRCPGKIWAIEDGMPIIVCGTGMLKISAHREDGTNVNFDRLRARVG